ncbi:MAG: hypothetical protein IPH00_15890 [Flavobacteriales bacterium]|nr:hypothetical protein [Flavobacteriales bacterium]
MSSLNRSACRRLTSTTSPVDSEQLSLLPASLPGQPNYAFQHAWPGRLVGDV